MKIAPVVIAAVALTAGLASPAAAADKVPVKLKVKDCKGWCCHGHVVQDRRGQRDVQVRDQEGQSVPRRP